VRRSGSEGEGITGRGPWRARRPGRRRFVGTLAALAAACSLGALGTMAAAAPAAAPGPAGAARASAPLVPPANPPANIPASSPDLELATDQARADEGLAPLAFDQGAFDALSTPEQTFVIENLERTARGLAPFSAMTAQLDTIAQAAAGAASDPSFPTTLSGGGPVLAGGGIWAGGWSSALAASYEWMYQDGWGGSNINCS